MANPQDAPVASDDENGAIVCVCSVSCNDSTPHWLEVDQHSDGLVTPSPSGGKAGAAKPGLQGLCSALNGNKQLSVLLVFVPLGFVSHFLEWTEWMVFASNFFAILPMAWLIGKSTENLQVSCGEVVGGLLNATFGNVVEMLLCIAGIRQNQIIVVQCTLVGSILSNLLLVMGTAFLWGGYWHHSQNFSAAGGSMQSSLLLLSVLAIMLPTVYAQLIPQEAALLEVSRGISTLMLAIYFQYLIFQLCTHTHMFQSAEEDGGDDEEEVDMEPCTATIVLGVCTVLTSCCAEYLIASIEGTIEQWKVTTEFVGIIVLPIIGNAAEHYSAILVAGRKKMDLALNIAVGSSCQMALLVTPFTVLAGWTIGTEVSLDFHPFQATTLMLSVLMVANVLKDGITNWLVGSLLMSAYTTIAMIYFIDREDAR